MDKINLSLEIFIINKYISMPKLFDNLGIDYRINGNMFCCFHHNENSPSAHLYSDDNGYRLWCFSENKMYGAWNVYKVFMPHINTNELAKLIFNKLSSTEQKSLLSSIDSEQELDILPYKQSLINFKKHKINISTLLKSIADSYINEA